MKKDPKLKEAAFTTKELLESIMTYLSRCVNEGMLDLNAEHYNRLLDLMSETDLVDSWNELDEVITRAKILEIDVAAWASSHGRTSVSLPWPKKK